jgi:hypothetical protein
MPTTHEWLDGLKAGDEVFYKGDIKEVSRVTKTQIHVPLSIGGYIAKFRKADGYAIGSNAGFGYDRSQIRQITPAIRSTIRRRIAINKIISARVHMLSTQQLEEIAEKIDRCIVGQKLKAEGEGHAE